MDKVRIGIIGMGNMGSVHAANIGNGKIKGAELSAVCDIAQAPLERFQKNAYSKDVQIFTDDESFFKDSQTDLVMICTPHYAHPDLAIAAMDSGRHIIVEKPIAVHKAEAERLLAAAAKHPELVKSAMFNQRTVGAHRKIKSLIDSGELGKIHRICWIITDWFRTQSYYDSGDWRASWRGEGGGVLLNQCPHQLDLFQWFFGLPCKVRAEAKIGKFHDIEVEDEVNAYMEYEDGKVANFIATTGEYPGTNRLEIAASRGRLVYEGGKLQFLRAEKDVDVFLKESTEGFGGPGIWTCDVPASSSIESQHAAIVQNVTNAILNGEKLIAPVEEGIFGLQLGNAMLMSGLKHKEVALPLDSAEFAEMLQGLIAKSRYVKKTVAASGDFSKSFGNN